MLVGCVFFFNLDVIPHLFSRKYLYLKIWFLLDIYNFLKFFFFKIFYLKKIKKTVIFFFLLDLVPNFIMWKYLYLELSFLLDISNWYLIFRKFCSQNFLHKKIKKTAIFYFFLDLVPNFIMWKYLYLELLFLLDISNWCFISENFYLKIFCIKK